MIGKTGRRNVALHKKVHVFLGEEVQTGRDGWVCDPLQDVPFPLEQLCSRIGGKASFRQIVLAVYFDCVRLVVFFGFHHNAIASAADKRKNMVAPDGGQGLDQEKKLPSSPFFRFL